LVKRDGWDGSGENACDRMENLGNVNGCVQRRTCRKKKVRRSARGRTVRDKKPT